MYILKSNSTDPYFNIALEQYVLDNFDEDFFIIAINDSSIIVGVNQNSYDEINALYVQKNGIKLVRRLSGGGAVFQDKGNLNFSYTCTDDTSALCDFSGIANLISEFLREKLGVEAQFSGRNDMVVGDKKFSGHARLKYGNKMMHHGTILVSSNKKCLTDALKFKPEKYADRTLRSNHERVTNLNDILENPLNMDKFTDLFLNYVRNRFPKAVMYELTPENIEGVNELVTQKYSTSEWNYGENFESKFHKFLHTKTGNIEIKINLENSIISKIRVFGDFFSISRLSEIEQVLIGTEYNRNVSQAILEKLNLDLYMEGISKFEFLDCLYNLETHNTL